MWIANLSLTKDVPNKSYTSYINIRVDFSDSQLISNNIFIIILYVYFILNI